MIFSGLDVSLVVVVVLLSFIGLVKGFLSELSSIINWLGSFYLTAITKPLIIPKIEKRVSIPLLPDIIVNVVLFVLFMIMLSAFMNAIVNVVKKVLPKSANGFLGFILGGLKGILISMFVLTGMNMINGNSREKLRMLENSVLYNYYNKSRNIMFNGIIESLLGDFLKEIQKNKEKDGDAERNPGKSANGKNNNEEMEKLLNIIVDE